MDETSDAIEPHVRLAALVKHEGWLQLLQRMEQKKQHDEARILAEMKNGADLGSLQREVDYARGFEAALIWVASLPERSETRLGRYLKERS